MDAIATPTPLDEERRLTVLRGLALLDTEPEPEFDDLVDLAAYFFASKFALVSLVDSDRTWYKAKHGMSPTESPREGAFCAYAINDVDVFVVPDASVDPRFKDRAAVTGPPGIRFYAGAPIFVDGAAIGTMCVLDDEPRGMFDETDQTYLEKFARLASKCVLARQASRASG